MKKFDYRESGEFNEDGSPIPMGAISDPKHCWGINCNRSTEMYEGLGDPPYGFICKNCGQSLRAHPFFGQNREYDRGNIKCNDSWATLSKNEKAQVYVKYGFQISKWLNYM